MTTTRKKDPGASARSARRFARSARVLGGITLTEEQAQQLDAILLHTQETAAAWVRRLIAEHSARLGPGTRKD